MQHVGKDIENTKAMFVTILKNELALHERDWNDIFNFVVYKLVISFSLVLRKHIFLHKL